MGTDMVLIVFEESMLKNRAYSSSYFWWAAARWWAMGAKSMDLRNRKREDYSYIQIKFAAFSQ